MGIRLRSNMTLTFKTNEKQSKILQKYVNIYYIIQIILQIDKFYYLFLTASHRFHLRPFNQFFQGPAFGEQVRFGRKRADFKIADL